nr:unnamed protein product [Callosobruchus chinensis]
MIETGASPDIRYLSPSQRRCRFDDEPLTDKVPYYSTTICFVMCRYEMALKGQRDLFEERITFRWGLIHPTTKYRRDILFGFGDLVVSLGGTFNLFLGISFISLYETAYLLVEGIYKTNNLKQRSKIIKVTPSERLKD